MILFGHLGFGLKLAQPFMAKAPASSLRWLFLGCLLPDLIDKPLYYGLSWSTGLRGSALGLISGTRTFGHTALLLILLLSWGVVIRSRHLAALSLGVATHLLVDHLGDALGYTIWPIYEQISSANEAQSLSMVGLLWPFLGNHFPVSPHPSFSEHMRIFQRPHVIFGEIVGLFFLFRDQRIWDKLWKRAYSPFNPNSSS